jgi:serine/threonine protein kinase
MLTGSVLYDVHPMRVLFMLGKFQSYEIQDPNNELSDHAKDFVLRLLKRNPEDRMTLEEALKHPWLSNSQPSTSPLHSGYNKFLE